MKKEVMCGIYKITNLTNGKMYIGQSKNIHKRCTDHKSKLNLNKHINDYLQNSWNKYGEKGFKFEIIELCNAEMIDEREIFYIQLYNSYIREYGYNIELGGCFIKTLSEETKKKISIANTNPSKETRLKISIGNTGTKHGEATGEYSIESIHFICKLLQNGLSPSKISQEYGFNRMTVSDIKTKKVWKYISKNYNFDNIDSYCTFEREVVQYDLSFNKISNYKSIRDAHNITNANETAIGECCKNKSKTAKNFIWFYKGEDTEENILIKKEFVTSYHSKTDHFNKEIIQIDKDGNKIRQWNSLSQASRGLNIDLSSITKNCKGKLKQVKGYYFKYA